MHSLEPSAGAGASFGDMRITLGKIIAGFRFGVHRSLLKGGGIEFKGLRPYDPADNLSHVDLVASARISDDDTELVSREYEPERAFSVLCIIDSTLGMEHPPKKMQSSMFLLWLFALSTFRYHDSFSCAFFSERKLHASGWMTREEVLHEFLRDFAHPVHKKRYAIPGANLPRYLSGLRLHDTLVVVVSDFWGDKWGNDAFRFRHLASAEKNIRMIYFALNEWTGFTPVPFHVSLRNPLDGSSRQFSFRSGGEADAQKKAQEARFAAAKKALYTAGAPFISLPIFGDFAREVRRELLKHGFE